MRKAISRFFILCLTIGVVDVEAGIGGRISQIDDEIAAYISQSINRFDIPSIAIGIVDRNGLAWSSGFGYADQKNNILADDRTLYRAGSLAKLLTAAAILQLEETDAIDIDQALSVSLDGFSYRSRIDDPGVITPRHLLTHHSGLPSNINKGQWTDERFTRVVAQLRDEHISYPTNFILNYSNVGYSLLGAMLEKVTRQSFEDYMAENILEPLGMNSSEFSPYTKGSTQFAVGHRQGQQRSNLQVRDIPALGLNTNVQDMANFISAILSSGKFQQTRVLSPQSVQSMFQAQNSRIVLDLDESIGIPWMLDRLDTRSGDLVAEHSGSMMNYSSYIMLIPGLDFGLVMLSNAGDISGQLRIMSEEIVYKILNEERRTPINYYTPQHSTAIAESGDKTTSRYVTDSGVIELDTGSPEIRALSQSKKIDLISLADGWFGISLDQQSVPTRISEQIIGGHEVMVAEINGDARLIGTQIEADDRFNWSRYYGDYQILNPDKGFPVTDVRLFRKDKITYLCYKMPLLSEKMIFLPITPLSENEAITQGLGRARGETVASRIVGGEMQLIYSGFVARKISGL